MYQQIEALVAFLIPENLRNNKGVPKHHRRVVTALAVALDDAATVWFEPPFDPAGERPDFVVLDPAVGVLVVVVFAQSDDQHVLGAVRGQLRVDDSGTEHTVDDPLVRATRFGEALRAAIAADSDAGIQRVPVAGIAAFPYLSRDHAARLELDSIVPFEFCLFKDDIDKAVAGDGESAILRCFTRALEGGVAEPLTDSEQDRVRGLIHPEVVITTTAEQPSLFVSTPNSRAEHFRVMDRKQEAFAKGLGSGHRVIRGVAGSGKTLILMARARLLSYKHPKQEILVTCFTKALASVLRSQLSSRPNVEVVHLDSLMGRAIRGAGLTHPGYTTGREQVSTVAVQALELKSLGRYRAVLVDEGQDFDTDALRFCVSLAEPPGDGDGDVLIVADSAQNIFRRNFSWTDAGIKAQGRTSILRVNYRNTKQILQFAEDFLTADDGLGSDESPDLDDDIAIIPAETAERSGPEPVVEVVADLELEIERVLEQVASRYASNLPARSIAVLIADQAHHDRGRRIADGLARRDLPACWVTDPSNGANKDQAGLIDEPIVVSTVHSAKGLEFPTVIMCGLGGRGGASDGDLTARKTVYVGMTRALDDLVVVVTTDNVFASDFTHPSD